VFYTDGSLMDGVAGFAVNHSMDCNIGFRMRGPASVFTAVLAHVGIAGNEKADYEARQATLGNMVYNARSVARDLLPVAKQRMLDEWLKSWEVAETGKFARSIFPRVSLRPWFEEWGAERKLITTVSRIISGQRKKKKKRKKRTRRT
jgi:hypothetical protein